MRLGEWYDSIKDRADIECLVCGEYFCTQYISGLWRRETDPETGEVRWYHWCGNQWHPTRNRVKLTRASGEVIYISVSDQIKEVDCETLKKESPKRKRRGQAS